jgi:hypothetical protein
MHRRVNLLISLLSGKYYNNNNNNADTLIKGIKNWVYENMTNAKLNKLT